MTFVLTANLPFARDNVAPAPALHEDGSNFEFRMFFEDGSRIADADTPAELINLLSPGYSNVKDENLKSDMRVSLARSVQSLARAVTLSNLSDEDTEAMQDWEWEVLNFGNGGVDDAQDPFGWGDGTGTLGELNLDVVDFWSSKTPLILLETSYAPFTEIPRPISSLGDYYHSLPNMIWLRPQTELSLLRSLSEIGYITFGNPSSHVSED